MVSFQKFHDSPKGIEESEQMVDVENDRVSDLQKNYSQTITFESSRSGANAEGYDGRVGSTLEHTIGMRWC